MNIKQYLSENKLLIDKELRRLMDCYKASPRQVVRAMSYALQGGKRIRPILCLASAQTAGARCFQTAVKAACAVEMLHTYSLIHDDLPAMDNDDYRRGRLSCHKKFGVANAVLAGDALLTEAFGIIVTAVKDDTINAQLVKTLAHAAGIKGMIAGQAADITKGIKSVAQQEYINIHKTGALIAASCKIGALTAKAGVKDTRVLLKYGEYIGLVFQLTDDIIDREGSSGIIGKKRTFMYAKELTQEAIGLLKCFGKKADYLRMIADFILNRTN
jgi:geranylgeranyl diphosphate synthase, type II